MTSSAISRPPRTGAAIGRMTSAPTPVAQSIGAIEMIAAPSVSSLGRSRWTAPSRIACAQLGDRADPLQAAALVDRLAEVDEHHDAGLGRHAEAGDVADLDGDAEVEAEEPLEDRPAGQGPEHARHHQQRVVQLL